MICWRRNNRLVGFAGLCSRGLMIAPAINAASCIVEARARLAEVRARRRFAAEDAVAPLDHVQVDLEDALLGQRRLEPPRDQQLLHLAHRIARRRQVQVLRELLRDGAAAAQELPFLPVLLERRLDLVEIDAVVIEEGRRPRSRSRRASGIGEIRLYGTHCCRIANFRPASRASSIAQLHERRGRRIGLRERADVGQRQVDVGDVGEAEHCERAGESSERSVFQIDRDARLAATGRF